MWFFTGVRFNVPFLVFESMEPSVTMLANKRSVIVFPGYRRFHEYDYNLCISMFLCCLVTSKYVSAMYRCLAGIYMEADANQNLGKTSSPRGVRSGVQPRQAERDE